MILFIVIKNISSLYHKFIFCAREIDKFIDGWEPYTLVTTTCSVDT